MENQNGEPFDAECYADCPSDPTNFIPYEQPPFAMLPQMTAPTPNFVNSNPDAIPVGVLPMNPATEPLVPTDTQQHCGLTPTIPAPPNGFLTAQCCGLTPTIPPTPFVSPNSIPISPNPGAPEPLLSNQSVEAGLQFAATTDIAPACPLEVKRVTVEPPSFPNKALIDAVTLKGPFSRTVIYYPLQQTVITAYHRPLAEAQPSTQAQTMAPQPLSTLSDEDVIREASLPSVTDKLPPASTGLKEKVEQSMNELRETTIERKPNLPKQQKQEERLAEKANEGGKAQPVESSKGAAQLKAAVTAGMTAVLSGFEMAQDKWSALAKPFAQLQDEGPLTSPAHANEDIQ